MGGGEVATAAGNLSGDFFIPGQCKGNKLHECAEKNLSAIDGSVFPTQLFVRGGLFVSSG